MQRMHLSQQFAKLCIWLYWQYILLLCVCVCVCASGGEGYGAGHEQSADNVSKHSRSVSYILDCILCNIM